MIEIFRKYAAAGFPSYERERNRIYHEALTVFSGSDVEMAVIYANTAVENSSSYLADIEAADGTFRLLSAGNQFMILKAVKAVYCASPRSTLHRGDITNRVTRFAVTCPASEAQVYRWLKYARLLCAALRGLSISERDRLLYHISENDSSATIMRGKIKS